MARRPIAVSCGEPAGIGPEIAQRAWNECREDIPFLWIGDPRHLPLDMPFQAVSSPSDALKIAAKAMPIWECHFAHPATLGHPDTRNAPATIEAIKTGVQMVQSGEASALCTAPIAKHVLQAGGAFAYPGHTEFLGALAGVEHLAMMLASDTLRTVPVTIHIPLSDVPAALTKELLKSTLNITHSALKILFKIENPRIAVAGLNPHAGENGTMGREEIDTITPVLEDLQTAGMDVHGPFSADTMFHAAARRRYDCAVTMYHDQALIPIKTLAFDEGVNITLGLPFLRVSPDHGTALDIAATLKANPASMIAALSLANRLSDGN